MMNAIKREFAYIFRRVGRNPSDIPKHIWRSIRLFQAQKELTNFSNEQGRSPGYFAHFGVHLTGDNAGDVVLYEAVQRLFAKFIGGTRFRSLPLRKPVESQLIESLNRDAKAIVIGGGGLIYPLESSRSKSGWQWNIDQETLESINIPLILFAVGVNTFREQEGFSETALKHLAVTAQKAAFIGLRNHGSIAKIKKVVPDISMDKVRWQPCPTTFLSYFIDLPKSASDPKRLKIAINTTVDHSDLRFKGEGHLVLERIAKTAAKLDAAGHDVIVVTHAETDDPIIPHLNRLRARYRVKQLQRCLPDEVIEFYNNTDLTIGMRGHAQMIPFGCGKAVLSIKSHDKMGFFLEDIGHPEWGVEALEDNLTDMLFDTATMILNDLPNVTRQIFQAREKMWNATVENMNLIAALFPARRG